MFVRKYENVNLPGEYSMRVDSAERTEHERPAQQDTASGFNNHDANLSPACAPFMTAAVRTIAQLVPGVCTSSV